MVVWVVGRFANIFKEAKRAYISFVWVFTIDLIHKKNQEEEGEERVEPSMRFKDQTGEVPKIENLKRIQ